MGCGAWFFRFRSLPRKLVLCVDKIDVGLISVADAARSITIMMSSSASHLASLRKRVHERFSFSFSSNCSQCCDALSVILFVPYVTLQMARFELSTWRC